METLMDELILIYKKEVNGVKAIDKDAKWKDARMQEALSSPLFCPLFFSPLFPS